MKVDFERVVHLVSLELSPENLAKRMYRAKENANRGEYYALCLVKSKRDFDTRWKMYDV